MDYIPDTKAYILDDVVGTVLFYSKKDLFSGNPKDIHETFFELRKKFPILKGLLSFCLDSVYPYSKQLEDAIHTLQNCRIIGMENPDFKRYQIKEKGREFAKKDMIPLFDDNEKKQLEEMALYFDNRCGE